MLLGTTEEGQLPRNTKRELTMTISLQTEAVRGTKPANAIPETGKQNGETKPGPVALTGTVSGAQLTSATFTAPSQEGFPPGCSFSGTGTLAATTSSVSGSLAMAFPAACVGAGSVSSTATSTWTLSLRK